MYYIVYTYKHHVWICLQCDYVIVVIIVVRLFAFVRLLGADLSLVLFLFLVVVFSVENLYKILD